MVAMARTCAMEETECGCAGRPTEMEVCAICDDPLTANLLGCDKCEHFLFLKVMMLLPSADNAHASWHNENLVLLLFIGIQHL